MSGLFNFFRKVNMRNNIKLSDYPINIDTICFKINAELNESCYSDWENKYKFYQTIRFVNGSRVSIRYYHFYKCLSIYIDSLPGLLYGSSQELYKYSDYPHFKKILSDLLNGVMGLDEFKPDVWDYARIVRLDLNQDYYFLSKSNEEKFREWIGKFNMPYGKGVVYNSGKKNGTKSTNLTCYSKDEQLKTKYRNFENPYSHKCFCTRVEFQLKANYWKRNKIYLLNILSNNCEKKTFFDMMVNKMNMNGAIMNNGQFYYFLKKTQQEKRKDFAENIKKFYNELSKSGFSKVKKLPSYKNYIKYTTESGKNPIKLSDSVYKELVELKDIYYSEKN